ncbi:MAG: SUF system NifU family Fe-S cluster assembly protein [Candidatus Hinthialibacter antarcticus]|nr:SUF system NifU family Fe-S cluster assembly protein [Candidatus Hinthialibacter antarcticus]
MKTTAEELYRAVILEHARQPHHCREMDGADRTAVGYNPLCGDRCTVYLQMPDERIEQAAFTNEGCAISTASASIMAQLVEGKTQAEALSLFEQLQRWLTDEAQPSQPPENGSLLFALAGVRDFPMRVKCALLPWKTLDAALNHQRDAVTTE